MRRRAALLVPILLLVAACGSDDGPEPAASTLPPEQVSYGAAPCPPPQKPVQLPRSFDDAPEKCIEDGIDYAATVTTSEGAFTIDLLEGDAPITVNNFVVLARWGWFDGDDFHRVVPRFVIQAGDPVGQPPGSGGPGYSIPDELPRAVGDYTPGSVAMANRGPDSAGSQWFVCIECSGLPGPNYALFGKVTAGMDVVEKINGFGVGNGPPSKPIAITSITIEEKPEASAEG